MPANNLCLDKFVFANSALSDTILLMNRMKNFLRQFIPPILLRKYYQFEGHYTWKEAVDKTTGYDSDYVFNCVTNAYLKVRNGEAKWFRDLKTFDHIEYSWQVLSALLYVGSQEQELRVLDFGGSLGSTYLQNKDFLTKFQLSWNIVEQKHIADWGKKNVLSGVRFTSDLEDTIKVVKPNIVIVSSVLEYLENPDELLNKIQGVPYILFDRTKVGREDRITIQSPRKYNKALTLPCRFIGENHLLKSLENYETVMEWKCSDIETKEELLGERGYLFKLKDCVE